MILTLRFAQKKAFPTPAPSSIKHPQAIIASWPSCAPCYHRSDVPIQAPRSFPVPHINCWCHIFLSKSQVLFQFVSMKDFDKFSDLGLVSIVFLHSFNTSSPSEAFLGFLDPCTLGSSATTFTESLSEGQSCVQEICHFPASWYCIAPTTVLHRLQFPCLLS